MFLNAVEKKIRSNLLNSATVKPLKILMIFVDLVGLKSLFVLNLDLWQISNFVLAVSNLPIFCSEKPELQVNHSF